MSEYGIPHSDRRENLKSYIVSYIRFEVFTAVTMNNAVLRATRRNFKKTAFFTAPNF
jgi:hypothetical protein